MTTNRRSTGFCTWCSRPWTCGRPVRRPGAGVVVAIAAAVVAGWVATASSGEEPAGPGAAPPADTVSMNDRLEFVPDTVTVEEGATVLWTNDSKLVHTVTADPGKAAKDENVALPEGAEAFDSGTLKPGETFRHTFDVTGEYRYVCIPHEAAGMTGVVRVEAAE